MNSFHKKTEHYGKGSPTLFEYKEETPQKSIPEKSQKPKKPILTLVIDSDTEDTGIELLKDEVYRPSSRPSSI